MSANGKPVIVSLQIFYFFFMLLLFHLPKHFSLISAKARNSTKKFAFLIIILWSFSGPYFPAFVLNTGKYGSEKTPYLDTFHKVEVRKTRFQNMENS